MTRSAATKGTRAEPENRLVAAIDTIRRPERSLLLRNQMLVAVAREVRESIERELKRRKNGTRHNP